MWEFKQPAKSYDVVIIGGGLHGLATAYYLARYHGVKRIAVLERRYIGSGGSGRNTEMVRANKRAVETLPFYKESLELWDGLSEELEWNLMVQKRALLLLPTAILSLPACVCRVTRRFAPGSKWKC